MTGVKVETFKNIYLGISLRLNISYYRPLIQKVFDSFKLYDNLFSFIISRIELIAKVTDDNTIYKNCLGKWI